MLLLRDGRRINRQEFEARLLLQMPDIMIRPLAQVERQAIESAMILCLGNRRRAALKLGISRTALSNKLNTWRVADGDQPLPSNAEKKEKAFAAAM